MTYGQFLMVFLGVPIAGLATLVMRERAGKHAPERQWRGRAPFMVLGGLIVIAIVYTIPWDNHLIAQGVWRYDPSLVSGVTLGQIPIEEVLFFPLQTVFIWLWVMWLIPRMTTPGLDAKVLGQTGGDDGPAGASGSGVQMVGAVAPKPTQMGASAVGRGQGAYPFRWIGVLAGISAWLVSLVILLHGWPPGTYLAWELVWALPPLILQFGLGGDLLWQRRRLVLAALVPSVAYLSTADAVAIHERIWTISLHQSLGLLLGGVLPVEELIFFLLTSALVACGLILAGAPGLRRRLTGHMGR